MSSPLAASNQNSYLSNGESVGTPSVATPGLVPSQVLDVERLMQIAAARSGDYRGAVPFPHIMLDGLFSDALLEQAVDELPASEHTCFDSFTVL